VLLLTNLDESPWHQLPTTFDHVGTSDPRFFDRLWFAASDRRGESAVQFTIGVYQNMNVVDGGAVAIVDGKQHNLRVSRELRPRYVHDCGPLAIEVLDPLQKLRLTIASNSSGLTGELEWSGVLPPQEERHHFKRTLGRVVENYSRYDQIGECSGWLDVGGAHIEVDSWWACRDHSWGVREMVGIPEPRTGSVATPTGAAFSFLFFSTETHAGHLQFFHRPEGGRHLTAEIVNRNSGSISIGEHITVDAEFVDADRPRRFRRATFDVTTQDGETSRFEVEAQGSSIVMQGLGYGGYKDELGLGVWRGESHLESDVWDVSDAAVVVHGDGAVVRPRHRIQPVRVVRQGSDGESHGYGSQTFIAELPLDDDGHLRLRGG
jgi:hypothetical protein